MFHMSREIYDKALELAELIRQSKVYNDYKEAESAGRNDTVLAACEQAYTEQRSQDQAYYFFHLSSSKFVLYF